jgi:Flp pilus assembly protein TadG
MPLRIALSLIAARFGSQERGGVAVIFALTLIPLLMLSGMAIDIAANSNVRRKAQNAVDAAALSLAKLPAGLTDADLSDRARRQVTAAMAGSQAIGLGVGMVRSGDTIRVTATGTTPTTLTRIMAFTSLPLNVSGTSKRGSGNLEVALVLDNTGSMEGAKLANLKSAATDLVNNLFDEVDPAKPNALKVAVVPFSMTVNVGPGRAGEGFVDKDGLASYHSQIFASKANRLSLFSKMNVPWGGCVESRPAPHDVEDTPASQGNPDSLFVPYFAPDESDYDGNAANDYLSDYVGFAGLFDYDNRRRQGQVAKYGTSWRVGRTDRAQGSRYLYGPNSGCELQPITPLTTSKATVAAAISNMSVIGDTNVAIGLAWGWHVLSPTGPLVKGAPYSDTTTRKFAVVMTDGQNTSGYRNNSNASIYSGIGYIWANRLGTTSNDAGERTRAIDARLSLLCSNMKKAGIQIFTVRVEVDEGTSDLLRDCATNPSMFYDVTDSGNLTATFRAIGAQISELRISR